MERPWRLYRSSHTWKYSKSHRLVKPITKINTKKADHHDNINDQQLEISTSANTLKRPLMSCWPTDLHYIPLLSHHHHRRRHYDHHDHHNQQYIGYWSWVRCPWSWYVNSIDTNFIVFEILNFEFFLTLSSILTQSWHNIDTMLTQCWLCRRYPIHEERHFPLSTWLTLDEWQFPLVQLRTIDSCFSANPGLKTVSFCPTFHVGLVLKHVCSWLWWFSLPLPFFFFLFPVTAIHTAECILPDLTSGQ